MAIASFKIISALVAASNVDGRFTVTSEVPANPANFNNAQQVVRIHRNSDQNANKDLLVWNANDSSFSCVKQNGNGTAKSVVPPFNSSAEAFAAFSSLLA